MGEVWVAEQRELTRRTVAVKVIKIGMDTRQAVARFEAERQALAVMDHPAIAKVLNAAASDQGRPYFVMEYVKGDPITLLGRGVRIPSRLRHEHGFLMALIKDQKKSYQYRKNKNASSYSESVSRQPR